MTARFKSFGRWRRRPLVRQLEQRDCGPAALVSVLRYWGGNTSLTRVRDLARTDHRGTSLLGLRDAARALGFQARGARGSLAELQGERLPCIAHGHDGGQPHFVVVHAVTERAVVVGDPARGRRRLSHVAFTAWWDGVALLLEPGPSLVREEVSPWWRWIAGYLYRERLWIGQSLFMGAGATALGLVTAYFTRLLIDQYIPAGARSTILALGTGLIGLQVLRVALGYLRHTFLVEVGRRVGGAVGADVLTHVFRLPAGFFARRKTGDITARLHDAVRIHGAMVQIVGSSVIDLMLIVGSVAFLLVLAPPFGWAAVVGLPPAALMFGALGNRVRARQAAVMQSYATVESSYIDNLMSVEAIRGCNAGGMAAAGLSGAYHAFQDHLARLARFQARLTFGADGASSVFVVAVLLAGALFVVAGSLTLGQMVAGYSLLAGAIPAVFRVADAHLAWQEAAVAAARLLDILQVAPEDHEGDDVFSMEGGLHLRGAGFRWGDADLMLTGVDLDVPRGRLTGLCGASGAGKSTLVKLLHRDLPLMEGTLRLDDRAAHAVGLPAYRRHVAVLPESVAVLNGTLADNIALGRPLGDEETLTQRLADASVAHHLRRFPQGLQTVLGEDGRRLSSGERQLVGLMRAMVGRPDVLLVDEGLSTIDASTARSIRQTLRDYAVTHAVLIVSHDLGALLHTDYMYVLGDRRVVDEGPPRMLLAHSRAFGRLFGLRQPQPIPA